MKQLRILTGAHSGAQVKLVPGEYRREPTTAPICVSPTGPKRASASHSTKPA